MSVELSILLGSHTGKLSEKKPICLISLVYEATDLVMTHLRGRFEC